MGKRLLSLIVEPGVDCKVELPPCSALEIKHAALAVDKRPPTERSVLECDLATHSFVLCSLPPGGPMQASLGTVVTNDPDSEAWIYLKARGTRSFHILGRIVTDERAPKPSRSKRKPAVAAATSEMLYHSVDGKKKKEAPDTTAALAVTSSAEDDDDDDEAWPSASDVVQRTSEASSAGRSSTLARAMANDGGGGGGDDDDDSEPSEFIEVLLPEGDDMLEYPLSEVPSDDGSDDFVQWMTNRTQTAATGGSGNGRAQSTTGAPPQAAADAMPKGGSRTQRRRAAQKRARSHGEAEDDEGGGDEGGGDEGDVEEAADVTEAPPRGRGAPGRGRGGGGKGGGKGAGAGGKPKKRGY